MIELFVAEFRRKWTEFLRYPTEIVVSVVALVVLFYGLFMGASYLTGYGSSAAGRLDGIIVGYVAWTLMLASVGGIANEIMRDTQVGVLEQVLMSTHGATIVFLCRAAADVLLGLIVVLAVLFPILLLTGRWLSFSSTSIVPLGAVMLGALGIAFLFGAAALSFKRIQQFVALGQFLLLFIVMIPKEAWSEINQVVRLLLPLTIGVDLLRDQLTANQAIDWRSTMAAYGSGLLYATLGVALFRRSVRKAKLSGNLGWY